MKHKLGFEAVAVVAGINVNGKVVAMLTQKRSINAIVFQAFLNQLAKQIKRARTFVFINYLTLHHTVLVREKAKLNN